MMMHSFPFKSRSWGWRNKYLPYNSCWKRKAVFGERVLNGSHRGQRRLLLWLFYVLGAIPLPTGRGSSFSRDRGGVTPPEGFNCGCVATAVFLG